MLNMLGINFKSKLSNIYTSINLPTKYIAKKFSEACVHR